MSSTIACPKCKSAVRVKDAQPGKVLKCAKCGQAFKPKATPLLANEPTVKKEISPAKTQSENQAKKQPGKANGAPRKTRLEKPQRSLALPLLLVGGGVAAFVGVVVIVAAVWWWPSHRPSSKTDDPIAQNQELAVAKKAIVENKPLEPKDKNSNDANLNPVEKKATLPLPDKISPEVLSEVKDATVLIHVGLADGRSGSGSGFFVDEPGVICTNAHVLGMLAADAKLPTQIQVILRNGERNEQTLPAKLLAIDRNADLALVRIDGAAKKLPTPLPLADISIPHETQRVYIFGYPFGDALGKQVTISESAVSSLRKKGDQLEQIQVNGGIHPGNSGGPIVDSAGNLVGVSVSIIRGTQLNFAIPAQKAADFIQVKTASIKLGNSESESGQIELPVEVALTNPLRRVKLVRLQYWIGDPGPARAGGNAASKPVPGDAETQLASFSDPENALSRGRVKLATLPPAGKVLWCQPVITFHGGQIRWLTATSHAVAEPLTAGEIILTRKYQAGTEPILLRITSTAKVLQGDAAGRTTKVESEVQFMESIKAVAAPETSYRLIFRKAKMQTTLNGQIQPAAKGMDTALFMTNQAPLEVRADERGVFAELRPDMAKVKIINEKPLLMKYQEHVMRALELTTIPLNGVALKPGDTWRGARLPATAAMAPAIPHSFDLTYTYLGLRKLTAGTAAVISIEGKLRKNLDVETGVNYDGSLKGEALVNVANGKVVLFDANFRINHKVQFNAGNVNDVENSIDIHLARGKLPADSLAGLAGSWCVVQSTLRGNEEPLLKDAERWWIFEPRFIETVYNPRTRGPGGMLDYKLRPEIAPNAIDFVMLGDESRGVWQPGIFEITDKTLKVCITLDRGARPTEFSSRPNSERRFIIFERVDGGRPRTPIHVAKFVPSPHQFTDVPTTRMVIDAAAQKTPHPSYDVSKGLETAYTFRFKERVASAVISADGKRIACWADNEILCIDYESRQTIGKLAETKYCILALSPDASKVAALYPENELLRILELPSLKELHRFSIPKMSWPSVKLNFTPGGRYLTVLQTNADFHVWDMQVGKQVRRIEKKAWSFDLSADGKFILFKLGKQIELLDFPTLDLIRSYECPFGTFRSAAFTPDGNSIYVSWTTKFERWDRKSGQKVYSYNVKNAPSGVWISRDNQFIIAQVPSNVMIFRVGQPDSVGGTYVPVIDTISHTGRSVATENVIELVLRCAKTDPAFLGTAPVAVKEDLNKIPALDVISRFKVKLPGAGFFGFGGVNFSQDERFIVAASSDKKVHVFETKDGKLVKSLPTQFDQVTGVTISPKGDTVFVAGGVGPVIPGQFPNNPTYIAKIHVATGKEDRIPGIVGAFRGLKLSPDGGRLYGIGADYSARAWDTSAGKLAHSWENLFRTPDTFELSPDGKMGVIVIENGPVVVNLENFRDDLKLAEGTRNLRILGATQRAASAPDYKTLKIWDLKTGNLIKSFDLVHRDSDKRFGIVRSSLDGKLIYISGSHVGKDLHHVIDADTGKIVFRYRIDAFNGEQFVSPSGNLVAIRNVEELRVVEAPPMPKR